MSEPVPMLCPAAEEGRAVGAAPLVLVDSLRLTPSLGLNLVSCGLFISSGHGTHPDRTLDSYELIVVRSGTLSLWEGETRYDVAAEHALLLTPGKRHRGAAPFSRDLSFYWVHFTVEGPGKGREVCEVPKRMRVQRFDCVAELFHRYLDDQEARRLSPLYAAALLLQLLCEVSRPETSAAAGAVLVGRAEAFVTRHLAGPLSTAHIARALRTNPDYLNRAFREVHHMTVTEYVQRRRVADACGMLRETNDTIVEIAAACGYATAGHFRRMFQRHRGVSPAAYRQLMARAHVNAR